MRFTKDSAEVFYETKKSVAFDIASMIDFEILPMESMLVPTGLFLDSSHSEDGEELQIRSRSGLAYKHQLIVLNAIGLGTHDAGTIDADYTGEIGVLLMNLGKLKLQFSVGDRVAQGVINKTVRMKGVDIKNKLRGAGGFGSTGVK